MNSKKLFLSYIAWFLVLGVTNPYVQVLLRSKGLSYATVGLLSALFELAGILGPLFFSYYADREAQHQIKRRYRITLLAPLLALVSIPLMTYSPYLAITIIFVVGLGVALKLPMPLMDARTVAYLAPGHKRSYGQYRGAGSIAFIVMTLITQLIPGFSTQPNLIIITVSITLVTFIIVMFTIKETESTQVTQTHESELTKIAPVFFIGVTIIALQRLAMVSVYSFFSLYIKEEIKLNIIGYAWAIAAIAEVPALFIARRVIKRIGAINSIAISSTFVIIRLLIFAFFPNIYGLIIGQLTHFFCFGFMQPASVALVTQYVPAKKHGLGMALLIGLGTGLPSIIGALIGGIVLDHFSYQVLYISFSGFALLSVILYLITRNKFTQIKLSQG